MNRGGNRNNNRRENQNKGGQGRRNSHQDKQGEDQGGGKWRWRRKSTGNPPLFRSSSQLSLDGRGSSNTSLFGSTQSLMDVGREENSRRGVGRGRGGGGRDRGGRGGGGRDRGGRDRGGWSGRGDQNTSHENNKPREDDNGNSRNSKKRDYTQHPARPLRFDKLTEMLKREPNDIILCLVEPRSGLKERLEGASMQLEFLSELLKVLAKALTTKLHPENQNQLVGILLSSKFFSNNLSTLFCVRDNPDIFDDVCSVLNVILERMPGRIVDDLESCVRMCVAAATNYANPNRPISTGTLQRLKYIQEKVEDALDEQKNKRLAKKRAKLDADSFEDEPPEDFREISVSPTVEEIRAKGRPFLRKNVIQGRYKDADHYLDVHFRLLREDFVAPLRLGIGDYLNRDKKSGALKKYKDIRLYENVRIVEPTYNRDGVVYTISFDMTSFRRVKWEMSRRLIFGSLLCLSKDDFETVVFASVADRKLENLKQGQIKVKFEDDFVEGDLNRELKKSEMRSVYIMAESQAYFEAYRHVLKGLQSFTKETMPLQNYLVHVQRNMEPPDYLDYYDCYTFSAVLCNNDDDRRWQLREGLRECFYEEEIEDLNADNFPVSRQEVRATVVDIRSWPSPEELGMDVSQRKAMHLALSSKFAIIQGPPGTGKTFVGLKIMATLLSNRNIWRTQMESSPILVVCLTNHALDQFLEGMLKFTTRLVRVGGRSKNERLMKYNLRRIQNELSTKRLRATNIIKNLEDTQRQLGRIRQTMETESRKSQWLSSLILHENGLRFLPDEDIGLIRSFVPGFEEEFGVCPIGNPWCPSSFLAAWLGLTLNVDIVPEFMLEEFFYDETEDFIAVEAGGRQVRQQQQQLALPPEMDLPRLPVEEEDEDDGLIDVEDEFAGIERNRRLDADQTEEIPLLNIPSLDSNDWAIDVDRLSDPEYFAGGPVEDQNMEHLFKAMGTIRQQIAKRELGRSSKMEGEEVLQIYNVWHLSLAQRWQLYRRWIDLFRQAAQNSIRNLQTEYEAVARRLKEVVNAEELAILRDTDVVGLTTTGAAKYLHILQELGPKIVIVEEAAEVMESHIITSLSPDTEHLILIGDHQQLRPTPTVYKLAEHYHLDVSLFERMIKNEVKYETLQLQHRMRPEISRLLVPHIYKNLEDHESVRKYPHINGVLSSVFFLNHSHPEQTVTDSTTRSNPFEAEFLVALCHYLLQQGYAPSQITILTTYAGQLFALRNLMSRELFEGVQVTVVDNFQGEENDIILLSFVRSNDDGNIGFLKIDNRVNVALSRAKKGMFCIGNFKFLASKSNLWRGMVSDLERDSRIGDEMTLICQKHRTVSVVRCNNDFQARVPEGGCLQECDDLLPCGHTCHRVCHVTPHGHCEQQCSKILCELQHQCPLRCFERCQSCSVLVRKKHVDCNHIITLKCHVDVTSFLCTVLVTRLLPCEHVVKLACHMDHLNYACVEKVERVLPHCDHMCDMACHKDPGTVQCRIPCDIRLDCGHVCPRKCHPTDDVEHEMIECKKKCMKKVCERDHKCKKLCYQPCNECEILVDKELPCGHMIRHPCSKPIVTEPTSRIHTLRSRMLGLLEDLDKDVIKCDKQCTRTLPCGHQCKKICYETCGNCKEMVEKVLLCGHKINIACDVRILDVNCIAPCTRLLSCGHGCTGTCGAPCEKECKVPSRKAASCGHYVEAPCHLHSASQEQLAELCKHPCDQLLPCQHVCGGTCSECRQGRVHVPCKNECGRPQICGHSCTFPCATVCPPCHRKCPISCVHSRCPKKCGQPCKRCNERCGWTCRHFKCSKLCFEMCDRPRCDEPCNLKLRCGHPCVGLCGEKCPKLCRICNKNQLTEVFFGTEDEEDARFIELPACGHCIEVSGLDQWMDMRSKEIDMKVCPKCKTGIWRSYRYGNVLRRCLKDVQSVKKQLFGKDKTLRKTMDRLLRSLKHDGQVQAYFHSYYRKLVTRLEGRNPVHQNQAVVIENQINMLKLMGAMKSKVERNAKSKTTPEFLAKEIDFLSDRLMMNEEKMNEWELEAINKEVRRTELWALYMETVEQIKHLEINSPQHGLTAKAKQLLLNSKPFEDAEEKEIVEHLKKAAVIPGLGISDNERVMIVKAMSLGKGHWYKCPNGHVYAIGDCGGAMQQSTCNECGAPIGGGSHRLLATNAHAGEMDASTHPAWSERTGIGNYDLGDLV